MPRRGVNDAPHLPLLLARWFDERLHESVGFAVRGCRLYGVELVDQEGLEHGNPIAARACFLAEGVDREAVLEQPDARRALEFDAVAMVVVEWRPMAAAGPARPSEFAPRRRVRSVELVVTAGGGGASVLRFEHEPEFIVLAPAS